MNRTVIYARVSTEDQLERYGLPTQLRACREYAAKSGLNVLEEITDDGISGTILDRPGLEKVRQMVRAKQADVVLMLDVDRLSRDLAHLLILKPEIERSAALAFVTAKFEDSPSGRMFFGIRGVIAQYERELTRERTMRGRKERARSGLIVGGRVPYGYKYEAGKLTEDPDRSATVRRIYTDYEAGSSMRGIALSLRRDGVPTWGGKSWGKSSVRRILLNETYAGVAHYGTHRREGKLLRVRESKDRIPMDVLALVPRDQWERVQARLSANPYVGRPSIKFLLRGILLCGMCGRKMASEASKKSRTYRCTGRDPLRVNGQICRNHASAVPLDVAAWQALYRTLSDTSFLRDALQRREAELRSIDPVSTDDLRRKIAKFRRREDTALSLMLDPDLSDQRGALKAQYKTAAEDRRKAESELSRIEGSQTARDSGDWIEETSQMVREFMDDLREAEPKQQFARRLISKAEWNGEEIRMEIFIVPKSATTSVHCDQLKGLQVVVTARVAA